MSVKMLIGVITVVAVIVGGLLLARASGTSALAGNGALDEVHADIVADYPGLRHIETVAVANRDPETMVVFDTRKPDEFAVSHLEGAIRVDPDTSAEGFLSQYADAIGDKLAVFYCSVGRRSSQLAFDLLDHPDARGLDLANMTGGIFRWRNEGRPLVRNGQPTQDVHPYNRFWGRYLDDPSARVSRVP